MTPGIQAIVFDMDGVLCDSEWFIREAGCQMFKKVYQVEPSHEDFLEFTGKGEDRFIGGVAQKLGVTLTMPRDKHTVYELYLQAIQGKLQPLPGAVAFIDSCRARHIKLAVATSADRIKLQGNLKQIGLPPEGFDAVVTANDVDKLKPHPDLFLKAMKKMDAEPRHTLVVEDAPSGVEAAKAAGARCLGLTTTFSQTQLRERGADVIAPDLATVPQEALA